VKNKKGSGRKVNKFLPSNDENEKHSECRLHSERQGARKPNRKTRKISQGQLGMARTRDNLCQVRKGVAQSKKRGGGKEEVRVD